MSLIKDMIYQCPFCGYACRSPKAANKHWDICPKRPRKKEKEENKNA